MPSQKRTATSSRAAPHGFVTAATSLFCPNPACRRDTAQNASGVRGSRCIAGGSSIDSAAARIAASLRNCRFSASRPASVIEILGQFRAPSARKRAWPFADRPACLAPKRESGQVASKHQRVEFKCQVRGGSSANLRGPGTPGVVDSRGGPRRTLSARRLGLSDDLARIAAACSLNAGRPPCGQQV